MYGVATHLIIDESRRRRESSLDALMEVGFEPGGADMRERTAAQLDARRILAALEVLTDDEREALILRYVEGFSPRELAAMYGITANAMTVRLHRAKAKARHALTVNATTV